MSDSIELKSIESTEDPTNISKCIEKCKELLKKNGLNLNLVLDVNDVEEVEEEVKRVQQTFKKMEIFSIISKEISSFFGDSELLQQDIIPFHIIGVSVLMHGEADFIEHICMHWKEAVDFAVKLTGGKASEILKRVMNKHVKKTAKIYYTLLSASDYPGLCKQRGTAIVNWIKKVQKQTNTIWNEIARLTGLLRERDNEIARLTGLLCERDNTLVN